MLSSELIREIHQRLTLEFPDNLVLLGGSYFWQTATDQSDLDIYCVVPLFKIKTSLKKIKILVKNYSEIKLNVTIVPRFFYKRGWLSVIGRDLAGVKHQSKHNFSVDFADTLKLASFYYLKSLVVGESECDFWLKKVNLRLNYLENLTENWRIRPSFASSPSNFKQFEPRNMLLALIYQFLRQKLSFWPHYVIYNSFFLRRGRPLFLLANPDKIVLNKLKYYLENLDKVTSNVVEDLSGIVFPVLVVSS